MAASTREPKAEPKSEPAGPSLYELQQREVPPPPTPTQEELDQIALGTYVPVGTAAATTKRSGEAQEPGKR